MNTQRAANETKIRVFKLFQYSRCEFRPYRLSTQGAAFRQGIRAEIIAVVPAFSGVLAFHSFQSAFRSVELSGRTGFLVVPVTSVITGHSHIPYTIHTVLLALLTIR